MLGARWSEAMTGSFLLQPSDFLKKPFSQDELGQLLNENDVEPVPNNPDAVLVKGKVFVFDSEAGKVNMQKILRDLVAQGGLEYVKDFLSYFEGYEPF